LRGKIFCLFLEKILYFVSTGLRERTYAGVELLF
jgi:hypothetical protein